MSHPAIGHNRPPLPTGEEIAIQLQAQYQELFARRDEILAGARRFFARYQDGIPDETVQARAGDFAGGKGAMSNFIRTVEAAHATEKAPWLEGGRAVEGFKGRLIDPVDKVRQQIRLMMTAFGERQEAAKREAARREAEEATKRAAEAEATALETMDPDALDRAGSLARTAEMAAATADASAADLTRTRGELGTVVSMHTRWVFNERASDLMKLVCAVANGDAPLKYLAFNTVAINYAVKSEKVRTIPGCVIQEERTVL